MPSMITKCPGCGRNGIMSKATGKCFHCNKGSSKPKAAVVVVPAVVVTAARPSAPARPKPAARGRRLVGGRLV